MPRAQRQPPIMTMGLQPYVFTSMLLMGPAKYRRQKIKPHVCMFTAVRITESERIMT